MTDEIFVWRSDTAVEIVLYCFRELWFYNSTGWLLISNADDLTLETCEKLALLWKLKRGKKEDALFFAACAVTQDS